MSDPTTEADRFSRVKREMDRLGPDAMKEIIDHAAKVWLSRACSWRNGCQNPATRLAAGRDYMGDESIPLGAYCDVHADKAADQGHPEYHDSCPNCGTTFGVN